MQRKRFFRFLYFWVFISFVFVGLFAYFGVDYYRSKMLSIEVPVVEPELGPSKIRYLLVQKSQYPDSNGRELYDSLKFKQRFTNHKPNVIRSAEQPILSFPNPLQAKKDSKFKEQDCDILNSNKGWSINFVESSESKETDQNFKKRKFYRIRVATVKSPEQANEVWAVIKSKNPIVFGNCKFIVDKKSLSDGSVIYCIALGEYKTREDTYAMVSRLNNVGQNAYVYEVFK